MRERKQKNTYKHGARYTSTISLNDNLAMLKTLMLAYRATQQEVYKTEAAQLVKEINTLFNSHTGYFFAYTGNSAIKATYNITENIEACRLLNYSSYFFHEPEFKKSAEELFAFLTSKELVSTLSTEPGILSAAKELANEPFNGAFMPKRGEDLKSDYIKNTIAFPYFYFNSVVYTKETVAEDKKDLFAAFDKNFIVLCTSSYCSSQMSNIKDFKGFLFKRVLEAK